MDLYSKIESQTYIIAEMYANHVGFVVRLLIQHGRNQSRCK